MGRLFQILILAAVLFFPVFIFAEGTPVDPKIKDAILERLCPQPKEADFFEGEH